MTRIYLPPDANTLLSVADHCMRSRSYVNVIVAGKQPEPQWLTMDEAVAHCTVGLGAWTWAGTEARDDATYLEPDIVLGCAGDVPTLEILATAQLLRDWLPALRTRVVNVVDLMAMQPTSEHPHGLDDRAFDALFTTNRPVVFAFHGYPWLIHRLAYRRTNHDNFHVHGYKEEGTTTTPFDMRVRNDLDRFHLALDVIARVPGLAGSPEAEVLAAHCHERLAAHHAYVTEHGDDLPEIRNWRWAGDAPRSGKHGTGRAEGEGSEEAPDGAQ